MIKPRKLLPGDRVATVSPSSGSAGEPAFRWRYEIGVRRLKELFGFDVVAMPNSLKGIEYNSKHPEGRAEDLMAAFSDKSIKAIICNIGGDDSIRLMPFLDQEVICNNPKVLTGFSDTTSVHMICYGSGLSTFYGPALLTDFAENCGVFGYMADYFRRATFETGAIGQVSSPGYWTSEFLDWNDKELNRSPRRTKRTGGFGLLCGAGVAEGKLLGGCLSVLDRIADTPAFPAPEHWKGAIVFLETPETTPPPELFEAQMRTMLQKEVLQEAAGLIFARPYGNTYNDEYKAILRKLICDELGLKHMPVLTGLPFGHTSPIITLPIGANARIDANSRAFSILESGVI